MIDDNVITYYKGLAHSLGDTFIENDEIAWFYTGRRSILRFNGVLKISTTKKPLATIGDPVLDHFRSQGLPFFWADYPPGSAHGLGEYLISHDIPLVLNGMPAMSRRLDGLPELNLPPEVEISPVCTPDDEAGCLDVHMKGFNEPEQAGEDFQQYLRYSLTESKIIWKHFLGRWHGEPCAISTLLYAAKAAGIYHVTTLPAFRNRGLGKALTLVAMHLASALGYETSVLFATEDGYPLYQKLGFVTVITANFYVWSRG